MPRERQADVVYHLACLGVRHSVRSPVENHEVNATGTLRLLEASRGAGVPKFVYVSSSEVYGTARTAVETIRRGRGPVFIECMTYRWREHVGPHFDHELNRTYRTREEVD